jgi:TPR repeat protein
VTKDKAEAIELYRKGCANDDSEGCSGFKKLTRK